VKPYYEHNGITIYHGDCREIAPEISDRDFIFADPPYGVGFQYANDADLRNGYVERIAEWFALLGNTNAAITPGIDNLCHWPQPRWILAWLKANSMGASRLSGPKTVSRNQWEPILWYGSYPPNQTTDTIRTPIAVTVPNGHPCPKPLELLQKILSFATNETDVVLDLFLGSGTTLVAAKNLGRCAIGIEIEERYCEIAAKRLSQEVLNFSAPAQEGA
jgi:site-specific DNA-methyltransferase (adenine-specific)